MPKTDRNVHIDIIKGIAIVLGPPLTHLRGFDTLFDERLRDVLWTFIPGNFFIIGGYIIYKSVQRYSPRQFIYSRFKNLIIPFYSFLIVYALLSPVYIRLANLMGVESLYKGLGFLQSIIRFFLANATLPQESHFLWFFPAYFIANILFFVLIKNIRSDLLRLIGIICAPMAGVIMSDIFGHYYIPWMFDTALVMLPFMFFGAFFSRYQAQVENILYKYKSMSVLFSAAIFVFLWKTTHYMTWIVFFVIHNYFEFYVKGVLGFLFLYLLAISIESYSHSLKKFFVLCGKYAMAIYTMHMIILDFGWIMRKYYYLLTERVSLFSIFLLSVLVPICLSKYILSKNSFLRKCFLGI